jgi:hypothetical protein
MSVPKHRLFYATDLLSIFLKIFGNLHVMDYSIYVFLQINVRENRRDNQEWTIQENWLPWVPRIPEEDKQTKTQNNMCSAPQYASNHK